MDTRNRMSDPRTPEGATSLFEEKVSLETFKGILEGVLKELNGSASTVQENEEHYDGHKLVIPGLSKPVYLNLVHLHKKLGYGPSSSEENCAQHIRLMLKSADFGQWPSSFDLPDNLYLAVKTKSLIEKQDRMKGDLAYLPDHQESSLSWERTSVMRNFSSRSGELMKALVVRVEEGIDIWISNGALQIFQLSESDAFKIAVENTDRATPSSLKCESACLNEKEAMQAIYKKLDSDPYTIFCIKDYERDPVVLWMLFQDHQALPRLILPRVIECLAGALRCAATSTVVIPFLSGSVFVGNCESVKSMWWLADQLESPSNKERMAHEGSNYVSARPYRVRISKEFVAFS